MDIKSKKNSETDRAISSLKTASKMVVAAVAALATYFADCHLIAIIIAAIALLYTAFLVFSQKAIAILLQYFQRANRFNKIHHFYDDIPDRKGELPIKEFVDQKLPKRHRHHHKTHRNEEAQGLLQEIQRMPVFTPVQINETFQVRGQLDTEADKRQYEKQYFAVREQYKKSYEQVCGTTGNRTQFQARINKIHTFYEQKVGQLLSMNEANIRKMIEQLEKEYQVKIVEREGAEKSSELVNVTIDEAFTRVMEFKQRGCFPWTQKADRDDRETKGHIERIERIARDRREIDRLLAPYYPLNQKLRQEVVQSLERQIYQTTALGRQLCLTVIEIFNDRLRLDKTLEKYLIFKKDFTARPSLELSETSIHNDYHVDLIIKRAESEKKIICNPGKGNLWTLIGFALEAMRNNM